MQTKLIIVDGHSSVGKSSISKSVYKQLSREHEAYWLHEECENHPIRQDEFSFGELTTTEGMELNRIGMLQKWTTFRDSIVSSGKVCVTEGCLLHAYDRYFIHSIWDEDEINAYHAQVLDVIGGVNPVVAFLYRPDLRKSLEKAFTARGQWWQDLILRRDNNHVFFKNHVYVDENSMFEAVAFEQQKMMEIFDRLECRKIKIDTSAEYWDEYDRLILSRLGIECKIMDPHRSDLQPYIGMYRWQGGTAGEEWVISYDDINDCLYTSLFWPYMPMRCTAEGVFELISFPVEMRFEKTDNGMQFRVLGNYDWDYNDQFFIKV